jgi:serine/threonine protein kinase/outer membrane protein assembly factor BamB
MFTAGDKLESGHYTVIKELGQGGMGVVYHCHDELLQRDVALKMLLPELMNDQGQVETFHQEARLAAALEHQNIVTIYDIGKEDRKGKVHYFMAMEYLPGGNLSARLTQKELSIEHRLNWMKQLATGLSFAHKRGVVHRDIKADNIFITEEGDLKIGDFGLARLAEGRVRTRSVHGMGTPAYMSPELCRGELQDHRSDIYSMGILFYEIATGELPYKARGMIEMAMKHTSAPVPSTRKINPTVPEVLDKVIQKMMAKTPEERYQSMTEVLAVIDDLIFELRLARLGLAPKARAAKPSGFATGSGSGFFAQPGEPAAQAAPPPPAAQPAFQPGPTRPVQKEVIRPQEPPVAPRPPQPPASQPVLPAAARGLDATGPTGPPGKVTGEVTTTGAVAPDQTRVTGRSVRVGDESGLLWSFKTKGPIGWRSSPVANRDGSVLFVASADGRIYALQASNGSRLWSFETRGPIVSSPVVLPDRVMVASTDGALYCVDPQSGLLLWTHEGMSACVSTPSLHQDTLFVGTINGHLTALDAKSGLLKWRYSAGSPIAANPQSYGDLVFVGTKDGTVHALSVQTGRLKWKGAVNSSIAGGPMASADAVYVGGQSGSFHALEAETGRTIWDYETDKPILSKGVIVFTSVLFCSQDKWLYCCDKYDGRLMWKSSVHGRVVANLALAGPAVYAVTLEGWIQAIDHKTGALRWQINSDKRLESSPLVMPRMLYVGTVEGEILAYTLSEKMAALV